MFTSADLIGTDASVSVPAYFSAIPPSTVVQIRASGPVPKSPFVPACPFMTFDTNPVLGNIYSGAVGTTISTISNQVSRVSHNPTLLSQYV